MSVWLFIHLFNQETFIEPNSGSILTATLTAPPPWLHATPTISFGFHGGLFGRRCLLCIYCFMVMGGSGIRVGLDVFGDIQGMQETVAT